MNKKKYIIDNVSKLNTSQIEELIEIIKNNNLTYMENTNGIFIYLKNVEEEIIHKIYEHIQYCLDQKKQGSNEDNYQYNSMQHLEKFLGIDSNTGNVIPVEVPQLVIKNKVKKKQIKDKAIQKKNVVFTDTQKQIICFSKSI